MSDDRSTSPISVPSSSGRQRRASLASSFTDYLSKSANPGSTSGSSTGPMASAVANAQSNQGRRLSITTLGLSGSPTQTSSLGGRNFRQGSVSSSAGSNSANYEDAVTEDGENGFSGATPNSPFARRVSFGAHALRDARAGSISNGKYPPSERALAGRRRQTASPASGTPSSVNACTGSLAASIDKVASQNERSNSSGRPLGEGFNWSEALRSRAERAPSFGAVSPNAPSNHHAAYGGQSAHHQRAASIASMEQPARELPKQPRQNKPDFFQEKILRGDFMD
ncbi:hypothetical protein P170DRAFT_452089 [Aspergillus steynii IBT 23096]|uniref:Uncharacterized protein n=1 Tax=Aspergillus steynii IBT 23096 TaxID=1392250 RepID=A0A2I2GN50_9EURO|nr:uncharacterized protein P170DRAFT_452089 [Aspergillus steynii IBT 23096]PLB54296.1 hypothetical protein P170DRAFT_452089 [Aspergillus steynii IBT 23096]